MTCTPARNFRSIAQQRRRCVPMTGVMVPAVARNGSFFALTLVAAAMTLMLSASGAQAKTDEAPNVAALSKTAVVKSVIEMRGACQKGVAVFTVKNTAERWTGRGHLRIYDGQTGYMLRERWMRFDEGQSASFHIQPELVASARFKISVTVPDRSMTYKKSFRGRCAAPTVEANNVRR